MMFLTGGAVVAAVLVAVAPWRVAARPLSAAPSPLRISRRPVLGGPVWGAGLALTALVTHPLVAVVVLVWPSGRAWRRQRVQSGDTHRAVLRSLPETADLVALGIGAGAPVRAAVRHAAHWADDPFREVFVEALRRAEAGETFAAALETAAADIDAVARPLIGLLAAAESDGGALLAGLVRVSDDGRRRRRQAAAVRARRLPVAMLLPLVLCVLPAFVLLAVAPLVLTSLTDLNLGI